MDFRFSIFLLFWVWQWRTPQANLWSSLLIALLFYGTLEAIFWTCRLILAFVSQIVFHRHSLNLSTPMLQVRITLLTLIGLCGLPVAYAYIRFRHYLRMPTESLGFEGEDRRTDFVDWMCNSDYAVDAVGPLIVIMYLLIAFGAVEIIVFVGRGIGRLADRLRWRHKDEI